MDMRDLEGKTGKKKVRLAIVGVRVNIEVGEKER